MSATANIDAKVRWSACSSAARSPDSPCRFRTPLQQLAELVRGRAGVAQTQEAEIEHGAEHGRAERAAEVAREQVGRGGAAALGPVDDILDQDDRGAREEAHTEPHDEGAEPGERGELSGVKNHERQAADRHQRGAEPQESAAARTGGSCGRRLSRRSASPAPSSAAQSPPPKRSGSQPPARYIGRNVVSPMIAMPLSKVAPFAAAIGRRAQRSNAIIGSRARRSCTTNKTALTQKMPAAASAVGRSMCRPRSTPP